MKLAKECFLSQNWPKVATMTTFLAVNLMKRTARATNTSILTWTCWQNRRRDYKSTKERISQFTTLDGKKRRVVTLVRKEIGPYKSHKILTSSFKESSFYIFLRCPWPTIGRLQWQVQGWRHARRIRNTWSFEHAKMLHVASYLISARTCSPKTTSKQATSHRKCMALT